MNPGDFFRNLFGGIGNGVGSIITTIGNTLGSVADSLLPGDSADPANRSSQNQQR